jgi:hypothetical protein
MKENSICQSGESVCLFHAANYYPFEILVSVLAIFLKQAKNHNLALKNHKLTNINLAISDQEATIISYKIV